MFAWLGLRIPRKNEAIAYTAFTTPENAMGWSVSIHMPSNEPCTRHDSEARYSVPDSGEGGAEHQYLVSRGRAASYWRLGIDHSDGSSLRYTFRTWQNRILGVQNRIQNRIRTGDLSVATERSLCGHREISLWPQRDLSAGTKRSLCGHREISLWPQRDFSLAT